MGIIECQLDDSYKNNEMEKELKIKEDEGSFCIIEYNKTKKFEKNKKNENKTRNININEIKSKNNSNINEPYIDENCLSKNDFDCDPKENNKNEEDLIIITPRNNKLMNENYNNEITDDHTIKNETLVYNFENKNLNNNNNKDNKESKNINKQRMNNSKSFVTKRIVTKKSNINNNKKEINKDIPKNRNMKNKSNNKIIERQRNMISNLNSKSYNNIRNLKSCLIPPMFDYSFLKNNENENQQSSTLQNQNIQLKNIILQQLKEDILPNVERKTYQEDFFSFKEKDKSNKNNNNKIYFESKKNKLKCDKALFNKLCEEQNKYLLFGNDDNELIIDKIKNIYQVLYNKNNNENENEKKNRKNRKKIGLNKNIPIYRKETNFHLRNKSYNIENKFSMNNDNNNNSYFSLFNNSTNLSINFINKANKFNNNKSERNCKKASSFFFNAKNPKNNKNNKNQKKQKEVIFNQFLNYNYFNKKNYSNIKDRKNKTYIKKVKPVIFNSKSYNNIFNNDEKKLNYSNNDINMNHLHLLSHEYRDLVEVNMPKLEEETLININIINSIIGNKYIYSYKKIDNFLNDTILYDGLLYKVIDNMDNMNENNKYQLLERYFQITKNCFKYYTNISAAMNDKDKPLVQFDIRYIEKIEVIENNFLENYKINGEKDIKIIFCIYINQNNDFFIFAHYDRNFGKDVINILQFLQRYYEDMQ